MFKKILRTTIGILFLLVPLNFATARDYSQNYAKSIEGVVAVKVYHAPAKDGPVPESLGTGWFITEQLIVTAAHVVKDAPTSITNIAISGNDFPNKEFNVTLAFRDTTTDVAILKIEGDALKQFVEFENPTVLKLAPKDYKIQRGKEFYAIGNREGFLFSLYKGNVSMEFAEDFFGKEFGSEAILLYLDGEIFQGDSGGPIIDPATDYVIGIAHAIFRMNAETTGQYDLAISSMTINKSVQDYVAYGLPYHTNEGNLLVLTYLPGRPILRLDNYTSSEIAKRLNWTTGITDIKVNGIKIKSSQHWRAVLKTIGYGERVEFEWKNVYNMEMHDYVTFDFPNVVINQSDTEITP